MATKSKRNDDERREAPRALVIAAIVLLILVIGAGGYYAFNGGWKTAAMQDEAYKHEMLPIMAAKHGDMEPLEAENRLRKQNGQPLLQPHNKKDASQTNAEKMAEVRKRLGEH